MDLRPPDSSALTFKRSSRVAHDGTVMLKCYICEKDVCRVTYSGYGTVTCAVCQALKEEGLSIETIRDRIAREQIAEIVATDDLYNNLAGGFRAAGLGRKISDAVDKVKKRFAKKKRGILDED